MITEKLKVLMISSDRNLFKEGSAVSKRIKEYGSIAEELHIIVLSKTAHRLVPLKLGENIWLHPTNSISRWMYPYSAASLGKKIVRKNKFVRGNSIITTQDPFECGLAGLQVKKKWRLPLEVQLHTDPYSPYFSGSINWMRKKISKSVLKHADRIRTVSREVAEKITSEATADREKIFVLPIPVDKVRIEGGRVVFDCHARFGWKFVILMVTRLAPEKNIGMAIQALRQVLIRYPDTGLVIVGDGPEREKLEKLSKTLLINSSISFVGWEENLTSYYKTSNAFIQTSIYEGYGLSLIEAGISGLPIVSTPVGIAKELESGKEALICPQNDHDCLATSLIDLIESTQKREILRINMKHFLNRHVIDGTEYLKLVKDGWERTSRRIS